MPYIKKEQRKRLEYYDKQKPEDAGELNYLVTKLCLQLLTFKGTSYTTLNEIVGVLECCKQEFYRRVITDYEQTKILENGDVYD